MFNPINPFISRHTDYSMQLGQEGAKNIKEKVIAHRDNFFRIMVNRYMELLPSLIKYRVISSPDYKVNIDFLRMEVGLRQGYTMIVGDDGTGTIRLLGFTQNFLNTNQNNIYWTYTKRLTEQDIQFFTKDKRSPNHVPMKQILYNYDDGNFIAVYNKPLVFNSDYEIIIHYVEELAEIITSRFSLSMQMKLETIIRSEPNNEDPNKIINDIYNGAPYIVTSMDFDSDNIIKFDNTNAASNMVELKREYQNRLSELNNILGINTVGVEKNSGVSDEEVNSNNGYVSSNANIYLQARKQAFDLLKQVLNVNITPVFNDTIVSQLNLLNQVNQTGEGSDGNGEIHPNPNGLPSE